MATLWSLWLWALLLSIVGHPLRATTPDPGETTAAGSTTTATTTTTTTTTTPVPTLPPTFLNATNMRIQTKTVYHCNARLKTPDGKSTTCGHSRTSETFGRTLPLMDDGTLTILEDTFVVEDGQASVVAWPSRPYQYMAYVFKNNERSVYQFYNHVSYLIRKDDVKSEQSFGTNVSLLDYDWKYQGLKLVKGVNRSVWASTEGLPEGHGGEKFNFLGDGEVVPNKWILYLDETNTTLYNIEAVGGPKDTLLQTSEITYWKSLDDSMTVKDALASINNIYGVEKQIPGPADPDAVPYVHPVLADTHIITEDTRQFFQFITPADCKPRTSEGPPSPIDCYRIEKGTSSYAFFHDNAESNARCLIKLNRFQYPSGCKRNPNLVQDPNVCLFIDVDFNQGSLEADVGIVPQDITSPTTRAVAGFTTLMSWPGGENIESVTISGRSCAVVWQAGVDAKSGVSLSLCVKGDATSKKDVKLSMSVTYSQVGGSGKFTTTNDLRGSALPKNITVVVEGAVSGSAETNATSALVSYDVNVSNRRHMMNEWAFLAGTDFEVSKKILNWRRVYHWRWEQWAVGPFAF
ncbi:hypothetical protein FOL47_008234 [Perkinsus chesapeaki]|uniref:Protein arginine methyltransferase 10 n=1 Tax=Perkinsus chesapeaki TaxID=330153 RepID=A0A7J6LFY9_PERCH|nr:hypothetical protein FOL47_008234 [Perkinsus chesapeaki]